MSARWEIRFTKQAKKDVERLSPKLRAKLRAILVEVLSVNPFDGMGIPSVTGPGFDERAAEERQPVERYAGLVGDQLELVGLEAVRRSQEARRFQRELLALVFQADASV